MNMHSLKVTALASGLIFAFEIKVGAQAISRISYHCKSNWLLLPKRGFLGWNLNFEITWHSMDGLE